jgi:two-component system CheB/CheR fusion protein
LSIYIQGVTLENSTSSQEVAYWVGLGASAGGLEALTHCVANLRADSGCIYIVAQHMSPSHRSLMAEILGRETSLPVSDAVADAKPLPNQIYIIPPGFNLSLRDDCFQLVVTAPEISPKPSINQFFQSLAENYGERTIGVVLSGTGGDGTRGLQAIKAAGGITMAQTPSTAKYESMPQSAIEAGIVDRILDPSDIGGEIERLIRCAGALPKAENWEERGSDLAQIFDLVTQRTHIDFSGYKMATVMRRLQRRLAATNSADLAAYLAFCLKHKEELDALARETLISVTEFFRDRDAFRSLTLRINEIVAKKSLLEESRVWVIGCATGEEVYSIAMLFAEAVGERLSKRVLQIFATDIDEDALLIARRGFYPSAALSELPVDFINKYFQPVDGGMQVSRQLRECVTFARQNLISDPPFLRLDLVTCRNVLIYFNAELQIKALSKMHFALRDDGIAFLGRSENANHPNELFTPLDRRNRLFRRSTGTRRADVAHVIRGTMSSAPPRSAVKARPALEQRFMDAIDQNFATRAVLIDQGFNILYSRGDIAHFIDLPQGTPQMNLAQIIVPELQGELATTVNRARRKQQLARSRNRRILRAPANSWKMAVYPVASGEAGNENFLVVFEAHQAKDEAAPEPTDNDELAATREHLQILLEEMASANEEMQALNEEVQAANEELQAANEELEAANEELQASNQELVAVNEESLVKSGELAAVNADFESVYNTLDFPVLVFDAELFVKRVNSNASRRFDLPAGVAGQHLAVLRLPKYLADLPQRMGQMLNEQRKESYAVSEGELTWQVFITPSINAAGVTQSIVLVVIDQSDLARAELRLRQSREELLAIMNQSPSLVCLKDTAGRYHFANPRWKQVLALGEDEIIGKTDMQLLPANIAQQLRERDLAVMGSLQACEVQLELLLSNGKRQLDASSFPIFADDGSVRFICTQAIDVTHKQQAEEQLRLAAKVFDRAGEAISVTNESDEIITVNAAFSTITGYAPDEVIGKRPYVLRSGRHDKAFYDAIKQAVATQGFWQGEMFNQRKNGEVFPEWLTINAVYGNDGAVQHYVYIFSDISAIKLSQRRIEYMATHDELTHLPNRTLLVDRLKHGIAQAARLHHKLAVLFIDLDNFKNINDSLGHDAGDELLKEAARRLQSCMRGADTLARLGGDEFVALLVDVDLDQIRTIAARVVDFLSASFEIQERNLFGSASIGIAIYPDDGNDSGTLLKSADTAMYRAKEKGKNQYQFFADEMKVIVLQRLTLESGLRMALDHEHFSIAFQPKVELKTGRVVGAEALLRWKDHHLGNVPPAQFIPVAERCGLIDAVGERALKLVLQHMRQWQDAGLEVLPVSVNVSSHQLRNAEFAQHIEAVVLELAVPPALLCIEVTESSLMQDIEFSRKILEHLTAAGMTVSIDDFGTGYSSLAYLKRLPLAELKVDKSFVDDLDTNADDMAITTAVISLAHSLNLKVVAEGVERESHVTALKALGCEYAQGYYFYRPLTPDDFAALLKPKDPSS